MALYGLWTPWPGSTSIQSLSTQITAVQTCSLPVNRVVAIEVSHLILHLQGVHKQGGKDGRHAGSEQALRGSEG